jgi:hypothetical protein
MEESDLGDTGSAMSGPLNHPHSLSQTLERFQLLQHQTLGGRVWLHSHFYILKFQQKAHLEPVFWKSRAKAKPLQQGFSSPQ